MIFADITKKKKKNCKKRWQIFHTTGLLPGVRQIILYCLAQDFCICPVHEPVKCLSVLKQINFCTFVAVLLLENLPIPEHRDAVSHPVCCLRALKADQSRIVCVTPLEVLEMLLEMIYSQAFHLSHQ